MSSRSQADAEFQGVVISGVDSVVQYTWRLRGLKQLKVIELQRK